MICVSRGRAIYSEVDSFDYFTSTELMGKKQLDIQRPTAAGFQLNSLFFLRRFRVLAMITG